ncbi:MAG TPA: hypothetical protein VNH38_00950 [Candidatus Dormibacteraeota bacterium]|nr:hypothetical protein [Candidatus Dormibacteraeota bacterium]
MPAEPDSGPLLLPLPADFLEQLEGQEELLVSSRDRFGQGSVRMWFAVVAPGFVYLLTQAFSLKAERWDEDPWVSLRVPGGDRWQEGIVAEVDWEEAEPQVPLLTSRFAMAGAVTPEALRWMLQDGSRRLLKAGLAPPRSERVGAVQPEHGG